MSYNPHNLCVYVKALAGCQAGLIGCRAYPIDPNEVDYVDPAERADAFAQAIDTAWGSASYTNADLDQIFGAAQAIWANGRSPVSGAAGLTAGGYTSVALGIVAATQAGTAQIVAEGINPNGCGSGGGVTTVTGTAPIVSSGGAGPAISITPATESAAGSMSAADKTKLDAIAPVFGKNAASSPAATKQIFEVSVVVGPSGKIAFTASMNVQGGAGTAPAGDKILFQSTLDTVSGAGSIGQLVELSPAGKQASACFPAEATGLVPGSTHTVGIQATDSDHPGDTFELSAGGVASVVAMTW
jgi:hypothetical protein